MNAGGWRRYLKPLARVYGGAIAAKEQLLLRGWLKQRQLTHPVISVGSLSAGGAGKTPIVVMLAELLVARGFEVRILTRGYGRSGSGIERVNAAGDGRRFGDEPLMMARRLPKTTVWVGADRFRAGRMSEAREVAKANVVYLLDDGFQHRKLSRDVDVVLLTRQDLSDALLPAGNLRETLGAMRRADVVVLREDEGFAGEISGKAATWFIRRELRFAEGGARPARPVAFCGVARPEGFFSMLAANGIDVVAVSVFRDHHTYSNRDIDDLIGLARMHGADGFVTTEKDSVKLNKAMRDRLRSAGGLLVPELIVKLMDEQAKMDALIASILDKLSLRPSE